MRYSIISKGMAVDEIVALCGQHGVTGCRVAKSLGQVFCDLSAAQVATLSQVSGIVLKTIKHVKTQQVLTPIIVGQPSELVAQAESVPITEIFDAFRYSFTPPLTGVGLTIAVLDTGMRATHELLVGKIIYTANMTSEVSADDVFNHGTGVAGLIAQITPGAKIMNIKVLNDDGDGSEEDVVLGIEEVIELLEAAQANELHLTDEMYPNVINISSGAEDDGDPDDPIRAACREADAKFGLNIVAAAGNYGPGPTTVTLPATDPAVVAVGGMVNPETLWTYSSRGPTKEGYVKPDILFWAQDLNVASSTGDTNYLVKSGTSFSAPSLAAAAGLAWEAGRGVLGENFYMDRVIIDQFIGRLCGKPAGAPAYKDNDYGYGTPVPQALMAEIPAPAAMDFSAIIAPMIIIGMIGIVMKGVGNGRGSR